MVSDLVMVHCLARLGAQQVKVQASGSQLALEEIHPHGHVRQLLFASLITAPDSSEHNQDTSELLHGSPLDDAKRYSSGPSPGIPGTESSNCSTLRVTAGSVCSSRK